MRARLEVAEWSLQLLWCEASHRRLSFGGSTCYRRSGFAVSWLLAIGYWLLAIGYWLLAIGYWLLAIGYWLLAIGYWLSTLHGTVLRYPEKVSGARYLFDLSDRLLHWPTKSWRVQHRLGDRCVTHGLGHRAARHSNLAGD